MLLIVCYLALCIFGTGCNSGPDKSVDVSKIEIDYKSISFYKELFAIDTNNIENQVNELGAKYPRFSSVFFNALTGFNANNSQDTFLATVRHFLTYKDYKNLYDTVQLKFPDNKKTDKELLTLFKHVKYYFPEEKYNTVYYFVSGLNRYSAITIDSNVLAIGLDMYLGKDYPYYASVGLPLYEILHCEPEYIPVNASKVIFENKVEMEKENKTLLDLMIYQGLEMTFAEYTLPEASDELLMGYSKEQLKWCQDNERMIWSYFKKQDLLFSRQLQKMVRYVMDGPSSTGMPQESPGNIGTWMGWQIVRKYLKENPDVKWTDLLKKRIDSQEFLRQSKYKP